MKHPNNSSPKRVRDRKTETERDRGRKREEFSPKTILGYKLYPNI